MVKFVSHCDDDDDGDVDEDMNESTNLYKKSRQFKLVDKAVSHVANAHFKVLNVYWCIALGSLQLSPAIGDDA